MNILLTGGTGYIGSHLATVLIQAGHQLCLYDNLSNSKIQVIHQIEAVTGQAPSFVKGDVRDIANLSKVMQYHDIEAVIHLAGLKAVAESASDPLTYYDNNINGALGVVRAMQASHLKTLIFSSSATVYGAPQYLPMDEAHPLNPQNPYGRTKWHVEQILQDVVASDPSWKIMALRYFNPIGAHDSGLIGEAPLGGSQNLMPHLLEVAAKEKPYVQVWGGDYETVDGSGVRDYIHVMDLVEGHLAALNYLQKKSGWQAVNLGCGRGYSVLEMIHTFEQVTGQSVPYQILERRAGDVASSCASAQLAKKLLKWQAKRGLDEMCASAWRAHQMMKSVNKESAQ